MANKRIDQLPVTTTASPGDLVPIQSTSGTTFAIDPARFAAAGAVVSVNGKNGVVVLTGNDITTGTLPDSVIPSGIARDAEVTAAISALSGSWQAADTDLTAIAALSTNAYGRTLLTLTNLAGLQAVMGPTGTPSSSNFLRGDGTWITPSGGGTVTSVTGTAPVAVATGTSTPVVSVTFGTTANTVAQGNDARFTDGRTPAGSAGGVLSGNYPNPGFAGTALTTLGGVPQAQAINAQTGTTYTLVAGDTGGLVTMTNGSPSTLSLPQDSAATIPIGTYGDIIQLGAGQLTIAAGAGATLRTSGLTSKARAQYSRVGWQKISANTFSVFGDLAAS